MVVNQKLSNWINSYLLEDTLNPNNYHPKYLLALRKIRNGKYPAKKIKNVSSRIVDGPFGSQLKVSDYLSEGFPLYRVKNIQNCLIEDNDFVFIDKEKHSQLKRSEVLKDDVLITKAGRIGSSAVNKFERANITSHLCLIRTKDILDPYYLVAYLESSLGRLLSERLSHKSTRPELTKKEVEEIEILLPPRPIQEYIGNKVRRAEKLREEAMRLKEDFEKIINNYLKLRQFNYKDSKWSFVPENIIEAYFNPQYYNKDYIDFQDHLKKNNIYTVPLKSVILRILKNSSPDEEFRLNKGIPSIIVSDIDPYHIDLETSKIRVIKSYYDKNHSQHLLPDDVVYTTAGPPLGESCLITEAMLPLISGAHVTVFRLNKKKCYPGYIAAILNSIVGRLEVKKHCYGIRQQYLFNEQLYKFNIPLLTMDIQKLIHNKVKKVIDNKIFARRYVNEAKQDVEDLIEGRFDESKIKSES